MPSEKIKNAVSSIFLIENSDYMQLKDNIEILVTLIREEKPEVIRLLRSWFINFLNKSEDVDILIDTFEPLLEDKAMFAESVAKWEKIIEERGVEIGEKRGVEIGEMKQLEAAKKLKEAGVPIETIASCTGISIEVLKKL